MKGGRAAISGTGGGAGSEHFVKLGTLRFGEGFLEECVQEKIETVFLHGVASLRSMQVSSALRIRMSARDSAVGVCFRSAARSWTEEPGA